jgi:hypothetical protein
MELRMEEKIKEFEEYRVKVCKKANIYLFIGFVIWFDTFLFFKSSFGMFL